MAAAIILLSTCFVVIGLFTLFPDHRTLSYVNFNNSRIASSPSGIPLLIVESQYYFNIECCYFVVKRVSDVVIIKIITWLILLLDGWNGFHIFNVSPPPNLIIKSIIWLISLDGWNGFQIFIVSPPSFAVKRTCVGRVSDVVGNK